MYDSNEKVTYKIKFKYIDFSSMLKIRLLRYSIKENPDCQANGFENALTLERIECNIVLTTIIL